MKITSLKDIQELKTMVRVMDSTYFPKQQTKVMIGLDLELKHPSDKSGRTGVYYKESNYYWFNKSDLQKLTPIEYKGRLVGEGDMVLYNGRWLEVYGYHWYDDKFKLDTAIEKDYSNCLTIFVGDIIAIRPLYTPKPQDIIEVDGNRYQLIK